MTSEGDAATDGTCGEPAPPVLQDGEVIDLGSQVVSDCGGGSPLTMQWEIKIATGHHGKLLAREQ